MGSGSDPNEPAGDELEASTQTVVQRVTVGAPSAQRAAAGEETERRVRRPTPMVQRAVPRSPSVRLALLVMNGADAGRQIILGASPVVLGRGRHADVRLIDPGVSREHARIGPGPEGVYLVEDLGSANGTFLGSRRVSAAPLRPGDYLQLGALLVRFDVTDDVAGALHTRLYDAAVRDPLTGAFNRQYLTTRLSTELSIAYQTAQPLALLWIGVDGLGRINDRCGFAAGDRVLCHVTAQVMRSVRLEDVVARHGADEIVVLASDIPPAAARSLAGRLLEAIRGLALEAPTSLGATTPLQVTASIGVACLSELGVAATAEGLVALAERRLSRAKAEGRDRVVAGS